MFNAINVIFKVIQLNACAYVGFIWIMQFLKQSQHEASVSAVQQSNNELIFTHMRQSFDPSVFEHMPDDSFPSVCLSV